MSDYGDLLVIDNEMRDARRASTQARAPFCAGGGLFGDAEESAAASRSYLAALTEWQNEQAARASAAEDRLTEALSARGIDRRHWDAYTEGHADAPTADAYAEAVAEASRRDAEDRARNPRRYGGRRRRLGATFGPAEVTMSFLHAGWTAHPIRTGGQPVWQGCPFTIGGRMVVLSVVDGSDGHGHWSLWLGEGDLADPDRIGDSTSRGAYRSVELGRWKAGIETRLIDALRKLGAANARLITEIESLPS